MNMRLPVVALPLLLALAGCGPGAAQYTKDEAPVNLRVDAAATDIPVAFAAGSAHLAPGQVARLQRLALARKISPTDRVTVAASGGPDLAMRRFAAIERELLAYGIVPEAAGLAAVPANHAIVHVARYLVTLPPCPNWSKPASADFTNQVGSNFGCATASNLGLQVANPADLAAGRELGPDNGVMAANAMQRYLNNTVYTPQQFDGASASPGGTAGQNSSSSSGSGGK